MPDEPNPTASRGDAWAAQVRDAYSLAPDGDALVTEVARLIDRVDLLQNVIDALDTPMTRTSQGERLHPAFAEQRSSITVLHRALSSLNLDPDDLP
jgi:hypothetical protein